MFVLLGCRKGKCEEFEDAGEGLTLHRSRRICAQRFLNLEHYEGKKTSSISTKKRGGARDQCLFDVLHFCPKQVGADFQM